MRIGFDVSQTGSGKAGCGYYAHALIKALLELESGHSFSLYPSFGDYYFDPRMPLSCPYEGHQVQYGPRHLTRESAAVFWNAPRLEDALDHPDVVHSNNFWAPMGLQSTRLIYTLYDLAFMVEPAWTTEENRIGCFDGVFRASIAADWIVAISDASKDDFLRHFPHFPSERIRVIYPCSRFVDGAILGRRPGLLENVEAERFWLSVGTIEPRKNHHRLAEAYARYLAKGGETMPLVFAGGMGWLMEDFARELSALGITDQVVMTGYVSDEELIWLYRNCYANLYPSLFEGFGLPVLEGMQFGAATISSDSTSLPEVTGKAGVLLPPHDIEAWAEEMHTLGSDRARRQHLRGLGQERAAHFDWKRSAHRLLELYEEAASSSKLTGTVR